MSNVIVKFEKEASIKAGLKWSGSKAPPGSTSTPEKPANNRVKINYWS